MSKALSQMVVAAESKRCDAAEQHLRPAGDGDGLPEDIMAEEDTAAHFAVDAFGEVEAEVGAHDDLGDEHEHEPVGEFGVHVGSELAAFVGVPEEVAYDCYGGSEDLDGDMPAVADDL